MKIGLIGYGKMGKAIDALLKERQLSHEVVFRINSDNASTLNPKLLQSADVLIEFSRPECAVEHIRMAFEAQRPIIVGTTAWMDQLEVIQEECKAKQATLLYSPNFSIGVNLFFALNSHLASLMADFPNYYPELSETHHTAKVDAPSGTAVFLANQLVEKLPEVDKWELLDSVSQPTNFSKNEPNVKVNARMNEKVAKRILSVQAHRKEGVPGTHEITFHSAIDSLSIKHTAHNRTGFAAGALLAAEWILGKQGAFTMKDVLRLAN